MKIQKGKTLEELIKGSLEYTREWISQQFRMQYPSVDGGPNFYIIDTFAEFVVVEAYNNELMPSEFYQVTYTRNGETVTFAPRAEWIIVELGYQPSTRASEVAVNEKKKESGKHKKGRRFEESIPNAVEFAETNEDGNTEGPWRIKGIGITANIVNGNGRRYSAKVLDAAVRNIQDHLHESAGQGRLMESVPDSVVTGEGDHPKDKGNRQPLLRETVINWESVTFDGKQVMLEGWLAGSTAGKDIRAQMKAGIRPGISQRGYGESTIVKDGDRKIEEVVALQITGYDLTAPRMQSDPNGSTTYIESNQITEDDMLEELKKLLAEHPELFGKGFTETQLVEMSDKQLKAVEESIRTKLGIGRDADIAKALDETTRKAKAFDEMQAKAGVESAIVEATKDLPFGETLNKLFIESLRGASLKSADEVKAFVEAKRKEYGTLAAAGVLQGLGFKDGRITSVAPVLERETGIPEFGRASFEILETVRKHENRAKRSLDLRADSPAAVFTENLLKRFDTLYQHKLIAEARLFTEAEAASDLNLPYSVSRAIIAEAYPNLVAANVFDIGIMEQTPMNIYYEAYAGETGYSVDITDEVVTGGAEGTWYDLAHKNVVPGTVVVTSNPAGTSYVEGTDYVVDYMLGKILFLTAGSIGANDILIDYTYHATRQGEGVAIERAKTTLSYQTITAAAMRLADDINTEAIVFSRSQLGWDAVGRTMANLIKEMRRDIDRALIEKAVMAALSVASNSTAAWDVSDAVYATFVSLLGQAKVKVLKRFYEPTAILMSVTNADYLSNWDGFKRDGFPNALLNAAGFAGSVKGLPVFNSTEMRDTWNLVLNRELVMHRVYQPMTVKGPFPKYSSDKLIAAEQYYAEEFNASLAPIGGKGSLVPTQA